MPRLRSTFPSSLFVLVVLASLQPACGGGGPSRPDSGIPPGVDAGFRCTSEADTACEANILRTCVPDGEFLSAQSTDCTLTGQRCITGYGCVVCRPDTIDCDGADVVKCNADGSAWEVLETCDISMGLACRDGSCRNLCELAVQDKSYVGCEFYSADLDNAAIGAGRDASSQQYAVVVSNPGNLPTEVVVEANRAAQGSPPDVFEVRRTTLLPGDLEVFALPRREVDGSSSNELCLPDDRSCPGTEVCLCSSGDTAPPCYCRIDATASGMNDGTGTALTSQAYRVRSQLPIIAYQFNPLDNVGVFSNDASLLTPTSTIGRTYTVVGWPQTIADGHCDPSDPACAQIDFDPSRTDEDLRAYLSVLGTSSSTTVHLDLGMRASRVLGDGASLPLLGPGGSLDVTLGPFDVLNLETDGLNADFTGTRVVASAPVVVFVGSEASDAPRFNNYSTRQCCADHLETQLYADDTLGSTFYIARMPPRSVALNDAFLDPTVDSVAEVNEPEWIRVVAVAAGETTLHTTLPAPDDRIVLNQYQDVIIPAPQDFLLFSEGNQPVAVLQVLPSQEAVGIPNYYPGGDPAIIAVPPAEQYRQDYVFLTPDKYAFDFITITGQRQTSIRLDGELIYENYEVRDPSRCTVSAADGRERMLGDPLPDQVVVRCQLSFPDVVGLPNVRVTAGLQDDGVHRLVADRPVGLTVYGFDAFVSYAYAAGLNLKPIPR